jgi:hypothetical protein
MMADGGRVGNDTPNIQGGIGGDCRVTNRRDKAANADGGLD